MRTNYEQLACVGMLALSLAGLRGFQSGAPRFSRVVGAPPVGASDPSASDVTGTVKFDGIAPKPSPINMAQEPTCAKMHDGKAMSQDVVTGPGGSLANVIVYISAGLNSSSVAPPTTPAVIEQKGCMYLPHVVAMQAGQDLEVINSDSTSHNIHPMPVNNREWNKSQPPGAPPLEATFAREEIAIPVKCNIHPWMKSYIAVFMNPYYSVTDKDGNFELKNLPPGTYTITAWHEKFGTISQTITVGPNGAKAIALTYKARA
jgi:plastocyanin